VLIDPKGTDFERYSGATLLTPNMSEFEAVAGKTCSEKELSNAAYSMLNRFGFDKLLITRSEQGMSLFSPDEPELHLPTNAREVYDVTGAGDTVIATLGASLAAGVSLKDSCRLANVAAGIVVGKLGTSTVSPYELALALGDNTHAGFGVVTEDELLRLVNVAKAKGEKIVMTNGCFDILHAGHCQYLQQARDLGDRLIVAVNTDESVKRLKGETRPVNTLDLRMEVLASLSSVDWVVPFSEDTPQRIISRILPDILVKGGDYKAEEVVGYSEVTSNGGKVQILNFKDGCSTTSVIKKIQASKEK
jgi:D-beta-D-heptose 7-phosphate kinase/D-beta-D-heptose 1-phosphate adenosyltransferase